MIILSVYIKPNINIQKREHAQHITTSFRSNNSNTDVLQFGDVQKQDTDSVAFR